MRSREAGRSSAPERAEPVPLRARLAQAAPAPLRKAVRMAEHYARRYAEWGAVLGHTRPADARAGATLAASLAAAPLTMLRRLDGFEPPLLLADSEVHVRGVGRFALRAGTDDIIHVLPTREPQSVATVRACLNIGDTFVDAGANIGFYSVLAGALVGTTGRVVAIEMMPATAARLRTNFANNRVPGTVVEAALGEVEGAPLTATTHPRKLGQASVTPADDGLARPLSVTVQSRRLDSILGPAGRIRLLKMDLEGAEAAALRGAEGVLDRIAAILFEDNRHDGAVTAWLEARGFAVRTIDAHDRLAERTSR